MVDSQRGFNVGVFKAELNKKKLMRPNLFHVEFSIPSGLLGTENFQYHNKTVRTLEYWCQSAALSGYAINTYPGLRYGYGAIEQRVSVPSYGEIGIDVIFDAAGLNYDFFHDWMQLIMNTNMSKGINESGPDFNNGGLANITKVPLAPFEISYKDSFETDVRIYIYDQLGNAVKKMTLREAFPKALGDIRLAWDDNNTLMRLPVQLAYTDWYIEQLID